MQIRYALKKFSFLISHFSFQKGFTLIELLIVIAILGVLASGILVAINPVKKTNQAKDSTMKSNMAQIVNALQASFTANDGKYPVDLAALATTGELKTVPKQPNNENFEYILGTGCTTSACSAAVWGSYSDTTVGKYHCWDSTSNAYKIIPVAATTVPTETAPTCP